MDFDGSRVFCFVYASSMVLVRDGMSETSCMKLQYIRHDVEMNGKIKHIAASCSRQTHTLHSVPSLDTFLLRTLKDPRTHNLYLYLQNDPLNNIDPSGHQLQMGTAGNQPASLWGNCTLCNNDGRNVPANRTHCARCTRARIPTPQGPPPPPPVWVQPPGNPNPAAWSAPPSGGTTQASNNVSAKARAAEVKTNKKNSVNVPQPHIPSAPQPHIPPAWLVLRGVRTISVTITSSANFTYSERTSRTAGERIQDALYNIYSLGHYPFLLSGIIAGDPDALDAQAWTHRWDVRLTVSARIRYTFSPSSIRPTSHNVYDEPISGYVRGHRSNVRVNAERFAQLIIEQRALALSWYLDTLK